MNLPNVNVNPSGWSKLKLISVILVIAVATVGIVYAASTYTSNTVTVTPQEPETEPQALTLEVNDSTPTIGETITLTSTFLSPVEGVEVRLYLKGSAQSVESTITDENGVAIFYYEINSSDVLEFYVQATVN